MNYQVSLVDKIVINGVKGLTIRSVFCSTCIMSELLTQGFGGLLWYSCLFGSVQYSNKFEQMYHT